MRSAGDERDGRDGYDDGDHEHRRSEMFDRTRECVRKPPAGRAGMVPDARRGSEAEDRSGVPRRGTPLCFRAHSLVLLIELTQPAFPI